MNFNISFGVFSSLKNSSLFVFSSRKNLASTLSRLNLESFSSLFDTKDEICTFSNSKFIHIKIIPDSSSRFLPSFRFDLISDFKLSGDSEIIINCNNQQIIPAAIAIAKTLPKYSRKTSLKTTYHHAKNDHAKSISDNVPDSSKNINVSVSFITDSPILPSLLSSLSSISDCVRDAAMLVDTPPNELNCDSYVSHCINLLPSLPDSVSLEVIRGEELKEKGYGGLYNVGKASTTPPALISFSYLPPSPKKQIVLVGKGITYDTGGLSIKGKDNMPTMKTDMGGSAAVLYAFKAITSQLPKNISVIALLAVAENSVSKESMRPDDIITLYSGKSVEVNNTDAEGRLVLGDAVAHACKHFNPDIIIDLATLTGAQAYATGHAHAGVLSNSESLESELLQSGKNSGDFTFPLIYCPELLGVNALFKSDVADMCNSAKEKSNAPSSGAGFFVAAHLSEDYKGEWAHVDMAYPSTKKGRGTGYGVALLYDYATRLENSLE